MKEEARKALYIIIAIICVVAVFVGVFAMVIKARQPEKVTTTDENGVKQENVVVSKEVVNNNFKSLFKNTFSDSGYDVNSVDRINPNLPIVFEAITYKQSVDGKYDIDIHVPMINVNNVLAQGYNENTQRIFVNKANQIITASSNQETTDDTEQTTTESEVNTNDIATINANTITNIDVTGTTTTTTTPVGKTTYTIDYTGYINNDVLSLVIMASLKEGTNPQRVMIQTYNYNLKTKQNVNIKNVISNRGLDKSAVNSKIQKYVAKAAEDASAASAIGQEVYQRDLTSEIYNVDNVKTFFQGPNMELYIVYAYGNVANTSEMDIIEI